MATTLASASHHSEAARLSVSATVGRLKRLKDAGVATGCSAALERSLAGSPVLAIIGINVDQPAKKPFLEKLRKAPEVIECHHVAGAESYLITVVARSLADLERFIATINVCGKTRTSIVFSTPIPRWGLVALGAGR